MESFEEDFFERNLISDLFDSILFRFFQKLDPFEIPNFKLWILRLMGFKAYKVFRRANRFLSFQTERKRHD